MKLKNNKIKRSNKTNLNKQKIANLSNHFTEESKNL